VDRIIQLKKQVCDGDDKDGKKRGFVVINQKVSEIERRVIM
jgi:hypothetical protein